MGGSSGLAALGVVCSLVAASCGASAGGAGSGGRGGGDAGGAASGGRGGAASGGAGGVASGGAGGAAGGAGGATGTGGAAPPLYPEPARPALPDGPCKFVSAPSANLCGGGANCPVLVDGQFAGDGPTTNLDMVATAAGGAHIVFAGAAPSTISHCLFSVDATGASKAAVNPFPSGTPATTALATDTADAAHVLVGASGGTLVHLRQVGTDWASDALPTANERTAHTVVGVASTKAGIFALVSSHPPDAGYYRSFNLQLFSGTGAGSWQATQVFDGAGMRELLLSGLSVDASGAPAAMYETRQDLSVGVLGYASYLWRGGMTSTVGNPSATLGGALLQTVGDSITKDSAIRFTDADGYHLILPRDGEAPRALLVPGTALVPV
ncbi:MAG TPA: hypothetical protein VHU40_22405, partial [Polyangia bacterium]|nr:hypothetical protein [Polyangia bacterium]